MPPPTPELNTVIGTEPPDPISEEGIEALSDVLLINVVVRLLPFQRTAEVGSKFDPVHVRVNPGLLTRIDVGLIEFKTGTTGMNRYVVSGATWPEFWLCGGSQGWVYSGFATTI